MSKTQTEVIYLKDYTPPDFLINEVFIHFDLQEETTEVTAILSMKRNPSSKNSDAALILNGEGLKLKEIRLNNKILEEGSYTVSPKTLTITHVPDEFTLETTVEIKPQLNTRLSGLYKSNGNFCTQCESQGFRRITYYIDRPDVLSRFTTTISADKDRYPILLSNGNLMEHKELANNRHWVRWQDPSLKPCYLFALVAGNLDVLEDSFTTQSGKKVRLAIYVEKGKVDQAHHAMTSLKNAMRWDEITFGREYDLKDYMIVAVSDFNFGAMENKGLNIFNDKYILAKSETATDDDFMHITSVVGHEYFHNWSGNRVTVSNWFQITLKEGLTVFREQLFSGDMGSKAVNRIQDVRVIRTAQFSQDAGPMSHPIILDSYVEVNNFYTVTVYDKGAEVIRMIHTLLGPQIFRKAMDIYFTRNDGRAVTTEDFIKAMEDASGKDLTQFRRWYHQAGTPILNVEESYDDNAQTYTLTVKQSCSATPGQAHKEPLHIPLVIALLDPQTGEELPLLLQGEAEAKTTRVLELKEAHEIFTFVNIKHKPIPSLLRNFSAPVKLKFDYSANDLIFLMQHETDDFNRWDASQQLAVNLLLKLIRENIKSYQDVTLEFVHALKNVLENKQIDAALIAEMFILPSELYLSEFFEVIDVDAIHKAREYLKKTIAKELRSHFSHSYQEYQDETYELTAQVIGRRRLKNICLFYLLQNNESNYNQQGYLQFKNSDNMTDKMGALQALNDNDCKEREAALDEFYQRWQKDSLVVDKWLALQAMSNLPGALNRVKALLHHPSFDTKNPNRVRSLIGSFCANNIQFHDPDGSAYSFLTEHIIKIDHFNPQLAARLVEPFIRWRKFDQDRSDLMRIQLEHLASTTTLSNDVLEVVEKSLK